MEAVLLVGIQASSKLNPKTGAAVNAQRRRLAVIDELPAREAYAAWMEHLLSTIEAHHGAH